VAGQFGYCGLDRRRQPLTGDEIKGCWEGRPPDVAQRTVVPLTIAPARPAEEPRRAIEFVDVSPTALAGELDDSTVVETPLPPPGRDPSEPGWSLWGELDS
jgi:hypothetical protein